MKKTKYFSIVVLLLAAVWSCTVDENFGDIDFVSTAEAPSNITALYNITHDNTGLVTITPNSEGAVSYDIYYGDETADPENVKQGDKIDHTYGEGTYTIKIVALGVSGLKTEVTQDLVVSFKAPENLEVTATNDDAISKQVNVTATADYATSFEVYFGETADETPVLANIGDIASHIYQEAGTYNIRVVAVGAAIAKTEHLIENFEVTAILQPLVGAPAPQGRQDADVISIFSDAYTDVSGTNFNPNWGQKTKYSQLDIDGNPTIQLANLNYQGIQLESPIDASTMEYIHIDVWTADATALKLYPISASTGEKKVILDLVADQWNSFDIPVTEFTDQGMSMTDIKQFKLVSDPFSGSTMFIDNLYFYKAASGSAPLSVENFEGTAPDFTVFGGIPATEIVANPDDTGVNTTANVVKFTKTDGAQSWAGAFFNVPSALDFDTYGNIKLKVWSPKVGAVVKVKLETVDKIKDNYRSVDVKTTVANGWEELVFDFSGVNHDSEYVRLVFFFDFENKGDDAVYYFDEITLSN